MATKAERLRRIWVRHRIPVWKARGRALAEEFRRLCD